MKNYTELLKDFKEWLVDNKDAQYLWELNNAGKATYIHADMYAKGIAAKWSQLLTDNYGEIANTPAMGDVVNDIAASYKKAYSEGAYYAKNAQSGINAKNRIGIKAVEPALDETRLTNLVNKIVDTETTDEMREHLLGSKAVESVARSGVMDTMRANARLHEKAGLHAYVSRDASAGCCKWCEGIAGIYEYGSQPDDFWAVHGDCNCKFEYKPSRTARTDYIHFETENGKMRKITE